MKERIAKFIAACGICSRRSAEKLISDRRIKINGITIDSFGHKVSIDDIVSLDDNVINIIDEARVWLYYKPTGLITSHNDDKGRDTVFDKLPSYLPRVISIGRLDLNSEGLLILTNNSKISRYMELPLNNFKRTYKIRAFGDIKNLDIDHIKSGIIINGIKYKPADIDLIISKSNNSWFEMTLSEGKNREIRKIFEYYGLRVNRLIRISYGPFDLGDLSPGEIYELPTKIINKYFKQIIK